MEDLNEEDAKAYPVKRLCSVFSKSTQAYYQRDNGKIFKMMTQEKIAVEYTIDIRKQDPGLGGVKVWKLYIKDFNKEDRLARDPFLDVLDRHNLKLRKKKRGPRTTDSRHKYPLYPNLVKDFIPQKINELWVSDITYIRLGSEENGEQNFCFLSLILDAYSKEIIGWEIGENLSTEYPLKALKMALKRLKDMPEEEVVLIHHSDRGSQYASAEYTETLKAKNIQISMTESGNPKDNALAERVNGTIKNELLKGREFKDIKAVRKALKKCITFYNERRPHMSINMHTPLEASQLEGPIPKCWKSYREHYILKGQEEQPEGQEQEQEEEE